MSHFANRRLPREDVGRVLLAGALAAGLTGLVYGAALTAPFYSDNLLQIPWVEQTSLATMWRSLNPFDHYRPLQFSLWRLWYLLAGEVHPAVLRGANLFCHALAGLLAAVLAGRIWPGRTFPRLATLATYLLFPFAFDSVLWVSSFAYPLATAVALGALLAYLHARATASRAWHSLALLLTALSGLALESAVLAGPTIVAAEFLLQGKPRLPRRQDVARSLLYLGASALPLLLIWHFSRVPAGDFLLERVARNGAMLLQMTIFPFAPLLTPFFSSLPAALWAVAAAGSAFTALAGYVAYRRGWLPLFLFALVWIWLWNTVPALTQNYDWLRDPPRAFYPAAVGIALLWTALLTPPGGGEPTGRRRIAPYLVLLLLLLPAGAFLRGRSALYEKAGGLLWEVVDMEAPSGPALFINLPERITPGRRIYPVGYEGVIPMPPPTDDVTLLRAAHDRPHLAAEARAAGQILPVLDTAVAPAGPPLALADLQAADTVLVANYDKAGGRLLVARLEPAATSGAAAPVATFDNGIRLLAATCVPDADGGLRLALTWHKAAQTGEADTVFVHLRQGADVVAQADGAPVAGLYPFVAWPVGTTLTEERLLLAPDLGGPARIGVGLYDGRNGERYPALNPAGERLPEDTVFLPCP